MRLSSIASALAVIAAAALTGAMPMTQLKNRDVVAPPITYPTEGTEWTVGEQEHVDWDTSSLPPYANITNKEGRVVLGYIDECDPEGGLHLQLDNPLAEGFNITLGTIPITVPDVPPRHDYIIVLFGNSGNASPAFAISTVAVKSGSSSSSTASACPASTSTAATSTLASLSSSIASSLAASTTAPVTTSLTSSALDSSSATSIVTTPAGSTSVSRSVSGSQQSSGSALGVSASASSSAEASQTPGNGAEAVRPLDTAIFAATCMTVIMSTLVL